MKESEHQPFLSYSDEETNEAEPLHIKERRAKLISHVSVFTLTSLFWIAVLFIASSLPTAQWKPPHTKTHPSSPKHNITPHSVLLTCGTTPSSARAANCTYDVLLSSWIPAPCLDTEFVAEYMDDASYGGFADQELKIKLTVEQMSEMEFYYTSVRDHVNHCAVVWKKQFWMLFEESKAMDTVIVSSAHTDHCAEFLVEATEKNFNESTKVERGFAGCWVRE